MLKLVPAILISLTASAATAQEMTWKPAADLVIEGQGWSNTAAPFDRLPAKAEKLVRPAVWNLSRHSAGICVRFRTNAKQIHARWKLTSASLAMPHMPATGVSGVDLYGRDDKGHFRWVATGRPSAQENTARLVSGLDGASREYVLYFPLYNGVSSLEVGVPDGATLEPGQPRPTAHARPIVFYGTSITHGACASRPGMVHTAILGRWLKRPVINLGFSGNGRMEAEVAKLMTEIDAAVYVIDCLPNIQAQQVTERTAKLVHILREARPDVPIVLVEDRNYADSFFVATKAKRNSTSQAALRAEFEKLRETGVSNLHYISGPELLGDDGEATVDSSHPTDLGFMRQAQVFRRTLEPLVKTPK